MGALNFVIGFEERAELIKCSCPECGKQFSTEDEHAGRRAKCPNYKQPFVIAELQDVEDHKAAGITSLASGTPQATENAKKCLGTGEEVSPERGPNKTNRYRLQKSVYVVKVAKLQRILLWFIALIVGLHIGSSFFSPIFLLLFIGQLAVLVVVIALMRAMRSSIFGIVLACILIQVPVLGLLTLCSINMRATGMLRDAGYRVGFMGVASHDLS